MTEIAAIASTLPLLLGAVNLAARFTVCYLHKNIKKHKDEQ